MPLRINTDGTVAVIAQSALDAGRAEFKYTTVVSCNAPFLVPRAYVLVIDDFGAQDLPFNRKAWALYGRGHIFGPAYLAPDDGGLIPDDLVAMVSDDIEHWDLSPELIQLILDTVESRPEMLTERPE